MNATWTEHRNPEGRTYWYNTTTKESVWEKPDDLKTPFERALTKTSWKEYFSGGRKYYYNTETKESKWDMPDELLLILEKVEKERPPNQPPPSALTPAKMHPVPDALNQPPAQTNALVVAGTNLASIPTAQNLPVRPNLPDDPVIPHNGFATVEEGEKAFMHLLRKAGVDANWTWDQTMRAIITDPLYKALNTLGEKKAAWESYTKALKAKEQEEKDARLAKLRPALRNLLKGNPNVFHYTTFPTADKLFANHPTWQQGKIESERKLIFEEYVAELKQREVQETRAARTRAISKVVSLFKELQVDVLTRWRQAHKLLLDSDVWQEDPELHKLPTLDVLLAFEDYSRVREREFDDQMRRTQVEKARRERKARDGFRELLESMVESGQIRARSKWKEVYPSFKEDERYLSMLGNPGSNPLELFWDAVDALDQKLDGKIAVVEKVLKMNEAATANGTVPEQKDANGDTHMSPPSAGFTVTPETTEEQFMAAVEDCETDDEEFKALTKGDLKVIFDVIHTNAIKKSADEKRRAERRQRHLQDDLRYALKKLPEPLDINLSYEEAVPTFENLAEFKALDDEEGRRAAFAKFVKRQKERMKEAAGSEDGASTTSRRRKEPSHHDDHDRDRDRDRSDKHRDRDRSDRDRDYDRRGKHYRDDYRRSGRDHDDKDDKDYGRSGRDSHDRKKYSKGHERDRDRSGSEYREKERRDRDKGDIMREKRPRINELEQRAEKRARYDEEVPKGDSERVAPSVREDTPEEGEI
jgi:pre-mRNA-processing factor 40